MTSTDAAAGPTPSRVWNLPNILTMLRIALVPFFVWFLIADAPGLQSQSGPWRWAAVAAFAVMMAAVAITVWTGVEYVIEALRLRSKGKQQDSVNGGEGAA